MTDTTPRKYAIRRLNPFDGVTQVLSHHQGRALSTDGIHWEIQILAEKPDDLWGAERPGKAQLQYLRFGTWSLPYGLNRVPAHPLFNMTDMMSQCEMLVAELNSCSNELPFPLADDYELWLLDGEHRLPLALLDSHIAAPSKRLPSPESWRCGLSRQMNSDPATPVSFPGQEALEHLVRVKSGTPLTQWFKRDAQGGGLGLPVQGFDVLSERRIAVHDFPELLLSETWIDTDEYAMVEEYLNWISPFLLTLQRLSRERRAQLERHARLRAIEMSASWRLYPEVVDEKMINSARVEARLRRSSA
jgi:hypothetical protein